MKDISHLHEIVLFPDTPNNKKDMTQPEIEQELRRALKVVAQLLPQYDETHAENTGLDVLKDYCVNDKNIEINVSRVSRGS